MASVTRNPSTNRAVGAPPRHGEVRKVHQMLNAAMQTDRKMTDRQTDRFAIAIAASNTRAKKRRSGVRHRLTMFEDLLCAQRQTRNEWVSAKVNSTPGGWRPVTQGASGARARRLTNYVTRLKVYRHFSTLQTAQSGTTPGDWCVSFCRCISVHYCQPNQNIKHFTQKTPINSTSQSIFNKSRQYGPVTIWTSCQTFINCIIDVFSVVELKKCVFSTSSKLVHGET